MHFLSISPEGGVRLPGIYLEQNTKDEEVFSSDEEDTIDTKNYNRSVTKPVNDNLGIDEKIAVAQGMRRITAAEINYLHNSLL